MAVAQHLPQGRHQAGDRHLKFHETRDNPVVNPARYYFRMRMTFETASRTYRWLNRSIVVGSAMQLADAVVYDAYLVA